MQSIYGLVDPLDKLPHYIGRTSNVGRRLYEHLHATGCNSDKNEWLRDVKQRGQKIILRLFEWDLDDSLAAYREQYWIRFHLERGAPLTNRAVYNCPEPVKRVNPVQVQECAAMSAEDTLYIGPQDDLITVRERLAWTTQRRITLVIPSQTHLRSLIAWRNLHAHMQELGKQVLVISNDPQVRAVAQGAKFKVASLGHSK